MPFNLWLICVVCHLVRHFVKKILYFVTEDWYFCSHRMPLAQAARKSGYDVVVVTNVTNHGDAIVNSGLRLIPLTLSRRSLNPFSEILVILRLIRIYLGEKPDILHHVAMKPVLYGSIAAKCVSKARVINALAGLGWLHISDANMAAILKKVVRQLFKISLKGSNVIVQNPDDALYMKQFPVKSLHIIKGSGVDIGLFKPQPEPDGNPIVILPARLLWDKGIREFVEAAAMCHDRSVNAKFVLVGDPDNHNPSSIPISQVNAWVSSGLIEWWGMRSDMPDVYASAHIVCLPSYREGLPKVLLEAAACGRAIVTTDVPGCREVVRHGYNGLLVPARDSRKLASSIIELIDNPDTRLIYGLRSRQLVEDEYSLEKVNTQMLAVYSSL